MSEVTSFDRRSVVVKARAARELEVPVQRTAEANGRLTDSLRAMARVKGGGSAEMLYQSGWTAW